MVTLNDFIHLRPPVFSYSTEPLAADDWLRSIERKLQAGHVADGDRVNYAAYHLEGAANSWWENYLNMRPEGPPTAWNEFCTAFREHTSPITLFLERKWMLILFLGTTLIIMLIGVILVATILDRSHPTTTGTTTLILAPKTPLLN